MLKKSVFLPSVAAKSVANTNHEVVGVVKIVEAVAYVCEESSWKFDLEGKGFIEPIEIRWRGVDEIMAYAEVDGEVGHH